MVSGTDAGKAKPPVSAEGSSNATVHLGRIQMDIDFNYQLPGPTTTDFWRD
jgi:hypothetical protein